MSEEQRLLDALERETRASDDEVRAVRRFLAERTSDARVSQALLRHLPPATEAEARTVRARLEERIEERTRSRWRWGLGLGAAGLSGGLALAAALLLALALWSRPGEPAPISAEIAQQGSEPAQLAPADGVKLVAQGAGTVSGTDKAPQIAWTQGKLSVEVEPGRGIALTVTTREATVRVIGTAFEVHRDALGTAVTVDHGRVAVQCAAGGGRELTKGEALTCLPTTAPGLLARANTLKTSGASPDLVLASVEAGLPLASGPFRGELLALQAEMLLQSERAADALRSAREYLAQGGPRELEVLQMAARAALVAEGCEGALPYLHALEDRGAGDPAELGRCE